MEVKADVIVNASNGIGYMGGWIGKKKKFFGVAESIHFATQGLVEKESKRVIRHERPKIGDVFITGAHGLHARWIFHAITMKFPGSKSKLTTIEKCLEQLINKAREYNIDSLALTGLGTGTGHLPLDKVAELYCRFLVPIEDFKIILVDPSGALWEKIQSFKK